VATRETPQCRDDDHLGSASGFHGEKIPSLFRGRFSIAKIFERCVPRHAHDHEACV
jgi:hypothetical protein